MGYSQKLKIENIDFLWFVFLSLKRLEIKIDCYLTYKKITKVIVNNNHEKI